MCIVTSWRTSCSSVPSCWRRRVNLSSPTARRPSFWRTTLYSCCGNCASWICRRVFGFRGSCKSSRSPQRPPVRTPWTFVHPSSAPKLIFSRKNQNSKKSKKKSKNQKFIVNFTRSFLRCILCHVLLLFLFLCEGHAEQCGHDICRNLACKDKISDLPYTKGQSAWLSLV